MLEQDDRKWELAGMLEQARDTSFFQTDLKFVLKASQKELFDYVNKPDSPDEGYTVKEALKLLIKWFKKKNITNQKVEYFLIRKTCAFVYLQEDSALSTDQKQEILADLKSLYHLTLPEVKTIPKKVLLLINQCVHFFAIIVTSPFPLIFLLVMVKLNLKEEMIARDYFRMAMLTLATLSIMAAGFILLLAERTIALENRNRNSRYGLFDRPTLLDRYLTPLTLSDVTDLQSNPSAPPAPP